MQTFLPNISFIESAKCLDYKRLGKQRVEARMLLNILLGQTQKKGYANHPATKMWKGYQDTLKLYHDIMIAEWINRGYKNSMELYCAIDTFTPVTLSLLHTLLTVDYQNSGSFTMPPWLDDNFCSRHRSALLAKDFEYYKKFGWTEEPKYQYLWPTKVPK